MQVSTTAPIIVTAPIHFHPDGPSGKSPSPYPSEATAQRIRNGPVKQQWTRPQREALNRHAMPMNASDVVHKIVLKTGGSRKPSAKAHHGPHQRRNALRALHSRSCPGPRELDASLTIGLTRIRLHLAIYFCLRRGQFGLNGCKMASSLRLLPNRPSSSNSSWPHRRGPHQRETL
jgi:hypothetical protein